MPTKILNIHQRINAVMKDLAYVQKENKKVNNQYTFVSHDAVTAAVRGPMVKHGITSIPTTLGHSQEGNRTMVDVRVTLSNMDDPTDFITSDTFGYGIDQQDKGPGKAYSYAKKIAFLQIFCLETGDDPERDNVDFKEEEKEEFPKKPKGSHKMNQDMNLFIQEIMRSTSLAEFEGVKAEHSKRLAEVNKAWPEYMRTFEGERTISYNDQIKQHKARLVKQEAMDAQQAKEMEAPL